MASITLKPERMAQLEEFAQRRRQKPADALDDLLAERLALEQQDYREAVEVLEALREKHGLPR